MEEASNYWKDKFNISKKITTFAMDCITDCVKFDLMASKEEKIEQICDKVVNDLKELRESKEITTAQLSEMTGIAQPNITRMETGTVTPNLKTIATIAFALGAEVYLKKLKNTE